MKNVNTYLISTSLMLVISQGQAMPCGQFTSLGHEAETVDQVASSSATSLQIKEFKPVLAVHVSRIAGFGWFSSRKKAVDHIMKHDEKLTKFVNLSMVATRIECFKRPNESMEDVAIEEINSILNTVAENL